MKRIKLIICILSIMNLTFLNFTYSKMSFDTKSVSTSSSNYSSTGLVIKWRNWHSIHYAFKKDSVGKTIMVKTDSLIGNCIGGSDYEKRTPHQHAAKKCTVNLEKLP